MPDVSPAATAAPRRPVKRLVATIFVVALCFCAICGKVLLDARSAAWEHAGQVANSLVTTLASDISRNIESYDLSLRGVVDNLAYSEVTTISPELRQLVLFDRSATAKHLQTIALLDERGIVRLDARTPFAKPVDRSDRSYFQFHKNSKHFQLHISEPVTTRETPTRLFVVSRRLSNPDGSFAGVVAGSVRLSYFQELFKGAALGPNGSISLTHTDGTQLARWPHQEELVGRNFKSGELHQRLAVARSGQFEAASVADGVSRLVVYSQVGELPLVIAVAQSSADIYAQWRGYAATIGLLILLLCMTSVALALYLAREMGRRNAAEASLAVLATTDGLTGLSNRRHFNEAIDREWRRAMRERTQLALVMCDADLFKGYNDRHGHQAGDQLLQAIGAAMNQSIKRGADIAARYGGDEFAILLPAASADGAAQIADQVSARLADMCDQLGITRSHLSIGVAAMMPMPGENQSSLMAAADQALYRAKELGRNRIEIAPGRVFKPTLVEHSAA
jgi:diguanylate cyclase (GGDEF)-like protein